MPTDHDAWMTTRALRRRVHDPARVLVAEDDPEMLDTLVELLRAQGYDVQGATDGGRMLVELTRGAKCSYETVDLIVSDISMPVCSGMQIVETLRAAHCTVPVVLITGSDDHRMRMHAERVGAVLLLKPFSLAELSVAVEDLLALLAKAAP
jgi:DNA-binding response OmpR family regulator